MIVSTVERMLAAARLRLPAITPTSSRLSTSDSTGERGGCDELDAGPSCCPVPAGAAGGAGLRGASAERQRAARVGVHQRAGEHRAVTRATIAVSLSIRSAGQVLGSPGSAPPRRRTPARGRERAPGADRPGTDAACGRRRAPGAPGCSCREVERQREHVTRLVRHHDDEGAHSTPTQRARMDWRVRSPSATARRTSFTLPSGPVMSRPIHSAMLTPSTRPTTRRTSTAVRAAL